MLSTLEHDLIAYARTLSLKEVPQTARHQAKRRILDTLGGALAAFDAPTSRIARRLAQAVSDGPRAGVWGSLIETTPESAAFANGTMLRYFDINDTYRTTDGSHPSDNLGGIFAAAEMSDASGADVLLAMIICTKFSAASRTPSHSMGLAGTSLCQASWLAHSRQGDYLASPRRLCGTLWLWPSSPISAHTRLAPANCQCGRAVQGPTVRVRVFSQLASPRRG